MAVIIKEVDIMFTKKCLDSLDAGRDFTGPKFLNGVVSCVNDASTVTVTVRDLINPHERHDYTYPLRNVNRVKVSYTSIEKD